MSGTPHTPERTEAPLQGAMLWLTAIMLASANFIAVLDMTIANVSVPSISGSLGISSTQGTWIITSYAVAEAICVPLTGWIAGRFGPVRTFTTAMALFGIFSALCGFANSLGFLVFGRIMQGLAGGLLMPLSQMLLLRIFPKEKAPAAMALWAITTLIAPVLGPIVGGWICDNHSWPYIFFINVPLAIICSLMAARVLRRYEDSAVIVPIDKIGLCLMVIFVGSLQLMLDLGKEHDWFESMEIVTLAAVAFIGFIAFIIWELTERHPIVDLRVFRHRGFSASVVTLSIGFGAVFAANVLTPLWLQSYMGYTASAAGLATAGSSLLAIIAAPIAAKSMSKIDPRSLIFFGLTWAGFATTLRIGATDAMTMWDVARPLIVMGLGMPFFFVPLTALYLGSVEPQEMASAAGLANFMRTLSGAVATSIVTTSWENDAAVAHADLAGMADRSGETLNTLTGMGFSSDAALAMLDRMVQGQSVLISINGLMTLCAAAFCCAAFFIWFAPKPARSVDMTQAGGH